MTDRIRLLLLSTRTIAVFWIPGFTDMNKRAPARLLWCLLALGAHLVVPETQACSLLNSLIGSPTALQLLASNLIRVNPHASGGCSTALMSLGELRRLSSVWRRRVNRRVLMSSAYRRRRMVELRDWSWQFACPLATPAICFKWHCHFAASRQYCLVNIAFALPQQGPGRGDVGYDSWEGGKPKARIESTLCYTKDWIRTEPRM